MAATDMAAWSLRLLYINCYPSWKGSVLLCFRPLQIQGIEWNYHRFIIVNKSKMAASKMAAWSLKWLQYLNYYSTQKYYVFGFGVKLPSVIY